LLRPEIVPFSVSKIKFALPDLKFGSVGGKPFVTMKRFELPLNTWPVGFAGLAASAIVTGEGGDTCTPAAVYNVETPLLLSETQYGLVGVKETPRD